jgi:hypothetical protein
MIVQWIDGAVPLENPARRSIADASSACSRKPPRRPPHFHANLSGMLPELPHALKSGFVSHPPEEISQSGAAPRASDSTPALLDHPSQVCPTCGHRLTRHRCKLICAHCGYYMSCADYY